MTVLRTAVAPVLAAYLAWVALLLVWWRGRGRRGERPGPARPARSLRSLVLDVLGGYGFFLVIVVVFYLVLGSESVDFIEEALVEGSIMTFGMVLPFLLAAAVLGGRRGG